MAFNKTHVRKRLREATSYYKGCRKKCTRQSRKVLSVALRACTVLQRNLKEWYWRPRTYVCEYQRKATKVGSTASVVTNSVLIISHITFRDCRVHISSDNLSGNSCIRRSTRSFTSYITYSEMWTLQSPVLSMRARMSRNPLSRLGREIENVFQKIERSWKNIKRCE